MDLTFTDEIIERALQYHREMLLAQARRDIMEYARGEIHYDVTLLSGDAEEIIFHPAIVFHIGNVNSAEIVPLTHSLYPAFCFRHLLA